MIEKGFLDEDLRPRDRLGRLVPHRLNMVTFMRAIPGFASQFRTVPERFYVGEKAKATINCPCGELVEADTGAMTTCDGCERIYVWLVRRLVVGNSPIAEEAVAMS